MARSVDVLIVSYNTRDLLRDALVSLQEHAPPPDQVEQRISVLDNASVDGSADMVAAEFPAVRLVRSERNVGFAPANNRLAETSTADYVMLLNPDVILIEDVITPLLAALDADPDALLVSPRLLEVTGEPQVSAQRFPRLRHETARVLARSKAASILRPVFDVDATLRDQFAPTLAAESTTAVEFVWATCWLLRRQSVLEHGLFDVSFGTYDEDLDLCRRAAARGQRLLYVPTVRLTHLGGRSSTPLAKRRLMRRARQRYYRKHHGARTALAYRAVVGGIEDARAFTARRRTGA